MNSFLTEFSKDKVFKDKLIKLAIPMIIQNLIVSSVNMIDTLMIGAVGENELAGVGSANQIFFLYNLIIIGISTASGMFVAQYWGSKDTKSIKKILGFGLCIAIAFGSVFTFFAMIFPERLIYFFSREQIVISLGASYLRILSLSYIITGITFVFSAGLKSTNNTKAPMYGSLTAIVTNCILNWLLIFGNLGFPKLGVEGAAIATVIARFFEIIIVFSHVRKKDSPIRGKISEYFDLSKKFISRILGSFVEVILNDLMWGLGVVIYSVAYGFIGTQALAATQIANPATNFFLVLAFSLSGSSMVMIGNEIGSDNIKNAKVYAYRFMVISFTIGLIVGIIVYFVAPLYVGTYSVSEEVKSSATKILRVFTISASIRYVNCTLVAGIFRGSGDARFALIAEAVSMWLVGVPLAVLAAVVLKLRVEQVVLLVVSEEVFKFIFSLVHIKKGKWIKSLV